MFDSDAIRKRLSKLDEYARILRELQAADPAQFITDYHLYGLAERYLQLSIECLLDICSTIILGVGLRKPERYQEAITILSEAGVLSAGLAHRLAGVAGFRNILVHEYLDVDRRLVYRYLQEHLGDLEAFARDVILFTRSHQP